MRIVIVLVACGTPPAPEIGHATAHSKRELAGYPSVIEPADVACTLDGKWEFDQPDGLRFRDGGPVYATVTEPRSAHLELAGAAAFVEIDMAALRLWGFVDRGAMTLHASRAFLIADYLVPGPYATLRPIDATARGVSIELVPPKYMKPIAAPRSVRTCSDLSLTEANFDPRTAIDNARQSDDALAAGVAIPLSTRPDSQPAAELRFEEAAPVDVLERRDNVVRVILDPYGDVSADTFVVGWVPQSMLRPGSGGHSLDGSRGGGRGAPHGRPRGSHHVQCTHPVPLVVELGGERHLVGAIAPGVVITQLDDAGDTVEIAINRVGLQLAAGARSLAKREALRDCEPASL